MREPRIALVNAPPLSSDRDRRPGRHPTNGIRTLGGLLLDAGFKHVALLDGAFYDSALPLIENIRKLQPDVLGIPVYTDNSPEVRAICAALSDIKLKVVGGPYATARPTECLEYADVVFLKESEVSFLRFLEALRSNGDPVQDMDSMTGIAYRRDGDLVIAPSAPVIEDLDSVTHRGWELVADYLEGYRIPNYRHIGSRFASLTSSRGCVHSCNFCSSNTMHGIGTRFRSAGSIEEEINVIEHLRKQKGFLPLQSIKFDDDNFLARDRDDLEALLNMLSRKRLTFTAFAHINSATPEKLRMSSEHGMTSVFFGIETHEGRRPTVGKGQFTDHRIMEVLEECRSHNIRTAAGYIIGFPEETPEDMSLTMEAMVELPVDYPVLNILAIHPETRLWTWRERHMDLFPELVANPFVRVDRERWPGEPEGLPSPHPCVPKEELARMKRDAYFRAFNQPERKKRLLSMAKNQEEIRQTLDALGDFLYRACCGSPETQNAEKPDF